MRHFHQKIGQRCIYRWQRFFRKRSIVQQNDGHRPMTDDAFMPQHKYRSLTDRWTHGGQLKEYRPPCWFQRFIKKRWCCCQSTAWSVFNDGSNNISTIKCCSHRSLNDRWIVSFTAALMPHETIKNLTLSTNQMYFCNYCNNIGAQLITGSFNN